MLYHKPQRIRKLQRLLEYDYSQPGWYFITICTQFMMEWFGDVVAGQMVLNECGEIAEKFWLDIPSHYSDVTIDEFVIMPNHVHGIIVIHHDADTRHGVGTEQCSVPTGGHAHYGLISKIVMSYKNITTKRIHLKTPNLEFSWQRSYYDHIIRHPRALQNIRQYIHNNPKRWQDKMAA